MSRRLSTILTLALALGVFAAEAAREIDSRYVVTYKPRRPLAEAKAGEYRRLDVLARRQGLLVRSRRGYVARLP